LTQLLGITAELNTVPLMLRAILKLLGRRDSTLARANWAALLATHVWARIALHALGLRESLRLLRHCWRAHISGEPHERPPLSYSLLALFGSVTGGLIFGLNVSLLRALLRADVRASRPQV